MLWCELYATICHILTPEPLIYFGFRPWTTTLQFLSAGIHKQEMYSHLEISMDMWIPEILPYPYQEQLDRLPRHAVLFG